MVYKTRFYIAAALFKDSVVVHDGKQHLAVSFSGDSLLTGTFLSTVNSHEARILKVKLSLAFVGVHWISS